jgi:hypothetical protein
VLESLGAIADVERGASGGHLRLQSFQMLSWIHGRSGCKMDSSNPRNRNATCVP